MIKAFISLWTWDTVPGCSQPWISKYNTPDSKALNLKPSWAFKKYFMTHLHNQGFELLHLFKSISSGQQNDKENIA